METALLQPVLIHLTDLLLDGHLVQHSQSLMSLQIDSAGLEEHSLRGCCVCLTWSGPPAAVLAESGCMCTSKLACALLRSEPVWVLALRPWPMQPAAGA